MALEFDYSLPSFTGVNRPVRAETDAVALEVSGRLPRELNGTYYRVGADPTYAPFHPGFHATDGNGLMVRFRFHDGQVDFRSRYVQTERFLLERAANRALFGRYRNPYTDDVTVRDRTATGEVSRGTANTTMKMHAGILWALKEDSLGVVVEPVTLRTLGANDFGGQVSSRTMTAHPKVDARTGEMIFYGSAAKGETTPDIAVYTADAAGRITHEVWLVPPYASMIHDFAVTESWIIIPVMPTVSDLGRIKAGGPIYSWEPERGMYLGLLPRHGTADQVRWIHTDTRWTYHTMNAVEDAEGRIHIDLNESAVQPFPFFHLDPAATWSPVTAAPWLHRWTIDPVAGTFRSTRLSDLHSEFPRIDERFEISAYRHGWSLMSDLSRPGLAGVPGAPPGAMGALNSVGHIDHDKGSVELAYAGNQATFEEPQFVPRSPAAPEGDGFVLSLRHHHDSLTSDLVVVDTDDFTGEPAAIVRLPGRIRPGIHGCWVDEPVNSAG